MFEVAEPKAAVILMHGHAMKTERAHLWPDPDREPVFRVYPRRKRGNAMVANRCVVSRIASAISKARNPTPACRQSSQTAVTNAGNDSKIGRPSRDNAAAHRRAGARTWRAAGPPERKAPDRRRIVAGVGSRRL